MFTNVLILNGSPSGDHSITLYTAKYLAKHFPMCDFETIHVGQRIRTLEKDFDSCLAAFQKADLILFCYPVYTFLVPAQLHRFVELMKESGFDFSGKYAVQITTSKHFYDVTAHAFIEENCRDLGLTCLGGLSADMEDLLKEKGRKEAKDFFRFVLWQMKKEREKAEERGDALKGEAGDSPAEEAKDSLAEKAGDKLRQKSGKVVIITDLPTGADESSENAAGAEESSESAAEVSADSSLLRDMIASFRAALPYASEVINLREFPFAGGCLGCFHCASDGQCVYKDGFDAYLREHIQTADATVYAYQIKDHSMGYRFKLFDDRQFCNGHRTVTMGKPVAYLVEGDLDAEPNLQMLMEARAQVGGNYLAGIVSGIPSGKGDAVQDGKEEIEGKEVCRKAARDLAETLDYVIENHYEQPKNFFGVGGLKIFRDLIYQMQGLMRADHRFYKEHGFYDDFPQKHKGTIAGMYAVGAMMNNKKLQKKIGGKMTEGMAMPYEKVLREK